MSLSRLTRLVPSITRSSRVSYPIISHGIRSLATATATPDMLQKGKSDDKSMTQRDDTQQQRGISQRRRGGSDLISELERDMQQMMNSFIQPFQSWSPMRGLSPFIDTIVPRRARGLLDFNALLERPVSIHLEEKDNEYMMTIQAPGLKKEELDINVENDMLIISGEHKERHKGVESYVSFQRTMILPDDVDQEHIRAVYDDAGRLCRVHLPKKEGSQAKKGKVMIESTSGDTTGTGSSSESGTTTGTGTQTTTKKA